MCAQPAFGKYSPIGVEFRNANVVAVQFRGDSGQPRLNAAATWHISAEAGAGDGDNRILSALRELAGDSRFHGRRIVTALPGEQVDIRPLHLPPGVSPEDGDRFMQALLLEARSALPYPVAEAQIDYLPLGERTLDGEQRLLLLLVAARRENVRCVLSLVAAAGLECVRLQPVPCALMRLYAHVPSLFALMDMDEERTVISVGRAGTLLFSRSLPFGRAQVVRELASSFNITLEDASKILRIYGFGHDSSEICDLSEVAQTGLVAPDLIPGAVFSACSDALRDMAHEMKRSLDYFSRFHREGRVEQVFLLGSSMPPGAVEYLEETLGIPVSRQTAPLLSELMAEQPETAGMHDYGGAAGLALRET
jgi:type IV pilus assembly protein PilM